MPANSKNALDVAAALIEEDPGIDQKQLHELLYLIQATSLVWFGTPAFEEQIQAWRKGPVTRMVAGHYKKFAMSPIQEPESGNSELLPERTKAVVKAVVDAYRDKTGNELEELVKMPGSPWRTVRGNLPESEDSTLPIPNELIAEYHMREGTLPFTTTDEEEELIIRFLNGDSEALADLAESSTGVRPKVN